VVGDALGTLELGGHLVTAEVGLRDRHAEAELLLAARADRHAAHDLDAARERDIDDAGPDERGGEAGGLLGRAALGVHRGGRGGQREPGGEPCGAGDVERLLAHLADAAAHDLLDLGGVDAGAVDDALLDEAEDLGGMEG